MPIASKRMFNAKDTIICWLKFHGELTEDNWRPLPISFPSSLRTPVNKGRNNEYGLWIYWEWLQHFGDTEFRNLFKWSISYPSDFPISLAVTISAITLLGGAQLVIPPNLYVYYLYENNSLGSPGKHYVNLFIVYLYFGGSNAPK